MELTARIASLLFPLAAERRTMDRSPSLRASRGIALLLALVLVLAAVPGVATAESRSGGTVVVADGETVDENLEAYGGTIVVRGTVDGDLSAFGGDVLVTGEVTGDVSAFAGNVRITGTVGGNVDATGGNVYLDPGAEVGGTFSAAAGNVLVGGAVGGNAELAGGTVTLAETATIDGNVEYAVGDDGEFTDRGATVGGAITRTENVQPGPFEGPIVPGWVFGVYGFFVNLLLGAVLLLVFPRFSGSVAARVGDDPLRTGAIGLIALVAIPLVLFALLVTIVGIPLAVVGALLFGLLLWVGLVYGRFAVGVWLLSLADVDNRWLGLIVGLVVLGLVAAIPWIGGLVDFLVLLLGLGAVAVLLYTGYGRSRTGRA